MTPVDVHHTPRGVSPGVLSASTPSLDGDRVGPGLKPGGIGGPGSRNLTVRLDPPGKGHIQEAGVGENVWGSDLTSVGGESVVSRRDLGS